MKKIIVLIILGIIIFGIGCAVGYDWRKYDLLRGGYTILFNPNLKEGFVYKNKSNVSFLILFYPEWDSVYMYSGKGQDVFTVNQFYQVFIKNLIGDKNALARATIAKIIPYKIN